MNLMALDQSLTNTGVSLYCRDNIFMSSITSKLTGTDRLVDIKRQIVEYIERNNIDFIIMEDYAYSAHGHAFSLGELGGMIKLLCYDRALPLLVMPIQTHKIYTTGKGNTKKDMMLKEVFKKYHIDTENDNVADSISILYTFMAYLKWFHDKNLQMTVDELRAVKKVDSLVREQPELLHFLESKHVKRDEEALA